MYFLYHKKSCKTGKILGTALGIRRGMGKTADQNGPLIRWGNAVAFSAETLLQQREAISLASNKLSALRAMQAAGVRVPEFDMVPGDGVWLGRKRHGFGGGDIIPLRDGVCLSPRGNTTDSEFYTKYISNTREYRLHVFRGEVIRVQGKYLDYPEQHTNEFIKNYGQGFRFRAPDRRLNSDRIEAAINAVEALRLDFGAVDLLIGTDRQAYVLEVNTAPKCSPLTARAYIEAIHGWLVEAGYSPPAINYNALEGLRGTHE
jgi:glutathione synthase/RimK-type ligase-like ATP-grasp enzyme